MEAAWSHDGTVLGDADLASLAAASLGLYGRCLLSSVAVPAWWRLADLPGGSGDWYRNKDAHCLTNGSSLLSLTCRTSQGWPSFELGRFLCSQAVLLSGLADTVMWPPWATASVGHGAVCRGLHRGPLQYGLDPVRVGYLHLQSGRLGVLCLAGSRGQATRR